jgi:hypothetical protein
MNIYDNSIRLNLESYQDHLNSSFLSSYLVSKASTSSSDEIIKRIHWLGTIIGLCKTVPGKAVFA